MSGIYLALVAESMVGMLYWRIFEETTKGYLLYYHNLIKLFVHMAHAKRVDVRTLYLY